MAKKAVKDEFNMAAEIRNLLAGNANLRGREVIDALSAKFPKTTINRNSASVAFANARKQMGIRGSKKVTRRRRPVGAGTQRVAATNSISLGSEGVTLEMLKSARDLLQQCGGDAARAALALKSIAVLQMS